jgi:hypothetical protein
MSGPRFRHLAAFRMSFWNKQIGSEDDDFGEQKAFSHDFTKCRMTKSR